MRLGARDHLGHGKKQADGLFHDADIQWEKSPLLFLCRQGFHQAGNQAGAPFSDSRDISYIDGDITKVGDKYHLFYVAHEANGGIKQAVSDKINRDYVFDPVKYDPERVACEAPNLWKRNGTNTYVLMYDVFGAKPHTMGFSETTDFVHFTNLGLFNQGVMKSTNFSLPKHGAVMSLTKKEAEDLAAHWGLDKF